jgi:hypothetical protein
MAIERTFTERGFAIHGSEVKTQYDHLLRVQESSAASYEACWLFIEGDGSVEGDIRPHTGYKIGIAPVSVGVHMNEEQVLALRERLDDWLAMIAEQRGELPDATPAT